MIDDVIIRSAIGCFLFVGNWYKQRLNFGGSQEISAPPPQRLQSDEFDLHSHQIAVVCWAYVCTDVH